MTKHIFDIFHAPTIARRLITGAGLLILGSASLGTVQTAQAATLHYQADCGVKELNIPKGQYSIARAGAIKGYHYCEYVFSAKKGQQISASLIGDNNLYAMLYGTHSKDLGADPITLSTSGEQHIRVLQPRNQARRDDNTPKPYYLTVTIK